VLTGAAIFFVTPDGEQIRLTPDNVFDYANNLYKQHKEGPLPDWGIDLKDVTGLAGALKWVDSYVQTGTSDAWTEYLIRVEKDEAIPQTTLSCYLSAITPLADYVRIRLRGYGGERRITHDITNTPNTAYSKNSVISTLKGFINLGVNGSGSRAGLNHIDLHLEENITLDAGGGADPNFPNITYMDNFLSASQNCTIVMEPGSKLTNYVGGVSGGAVGLTCPVNMKGGTFELRGGELSACTNILALIYLDQYTNNNMYSEFIYRSGVFHDNDSNAIFMYNGGITAYKHYSDKEFRPQ
jgi:hypothetical protein